jgi:hypothetical protein
VVWMSIAGSAWWSESGAVAFSVTALRVALPGGSPTLCR